MRVKYDTALIFVRRREKYQKKKHKFLIVLNSLLNKPNKSAQSYLEIANLFFTISIDIMK